MTYFNLDQERKEAIQLLRSNSEIPFDDIRYFLELDRFQPLTESEWDLILYALDQELGNLYGYDCMYSDYESMGNEDY